MANKHSAPRSPCVRRVTRCTPVGVDSRSLLLQVSAHSLSQLQERQGECCLGKGGQCLLLTGPCSRCCQQPPCLFCRRVLPSEYSVLLGALSLDVASPHELLVPVLRVLLPPDYSEDEARGDLALLQLRHPVSLSARIQPVCLPAPGSHPRPGSPCWVTGWGSLSPGGKEYSQVMGARGIPFSSI